MKVFLLITMFISGSVFALDLEVLKQAEDSNYHLYKVVKVDGVSLYNHPWDDKPRVNVWGGVHGDAVHCEIPSANLAAATSLYNAIKVSSILGCYVTNGQIKEEFQGMISVKTENIYIK